MGGRDTDAVDYTYAVVASGPDVTKSEERKSIWVWKNTKSGDNEELDKTTKTVKRNLLTNHNN